MESEFEWAKIVSHRIKCIVFGFARAVEKSLSSLDESYENIPKLVLYMILHYYYHKEYFSEYSAHILANNTKTTLSLKAFNDSKVCSAFGNDIIEFTGKYIYKWRIYIRLLQHASSYIGIGFCQSNKLQHNHCFSESDTIHSLAYFDSDQVEISGQEYNFNGMDGYDHNDIIEMEINTKKKTLLFYKNDRAQNIIELNKLSLDLTRDYRFAITMKLVASIELLGYDKSLI